MTYNTECLSDKIILSIEECVVVAQLRFGRADEDILLASSNLYSHHFNNLHLDCMITFWSGLTALLY